MGERGQSALKTQAMRRLELSKAASAEERRTELSETVDNGRRDSRGAGKHVNERRSCQHQRQQQSAEAILKMEQAEIALQDNQKIDDLKRRLNNSKAAKVAAQKGKELAGKRSVKCMAGAKLSHDLIAALSRLDCEIFCSASSCWSAFRMVSSSQKGWLLVEQCVEHSFCVCSLTCPLTAFSHSDLDPKGNTCIVKVLQLYVERETEGWL